jgi:hypothetical protein
MRIVDYEMGLQSQRRFKDIDYLRQLQTFDEEPTFEQWRSTKRMMGLNQFRYDYHEADAELDDDTDDVFRYMGGFVVMYKDSSKLFIYAPNKYFRIMSPDLQEVESLIWENEIM